MKITITDEFRSICQQIIKENRSMGEWAVMESDDMFQAESYCGGYDVNECAFCFSYYDNHENEYVFQLGLEEIMKVLSHELSAFEAQLACSPIKRQS